jgi:hypothetical protein
MFPFIHPALTKAHAVHDITRPRPPKQRSSRRLAVRWASVRRAERPAEAARPTAAKPAHR